MSNTLKEKANFITGYQASLMIQATKGTGVRNEDDRNYFNTRLTGDDYDAWQSLERVGLAIKKAMIEGYFTFQLTEEGLKLVDYLVQLFNQDDEILF